MNLEKVIFSGPRPMANGDAVSRTVRILQTADVGRPGFVPLLRLEAAMVWATGDDGRERGYVLGPGDQVTPAIEKPKEPAQTSRKATRATGGTQ